VNSKLPTPSIVAEFLLCVVIAPLLVLAVLWIPLGASGLGATADFIQFYLAGDLVLRGEAPHLYELASQSEVLRQFTHPPFEAVLYAPFAHFHYNLAFRLWALLSLGSLGATFFVVRRYGKPFGLPERLLLLSTVFYPVFAAIVQGQDSLLTLLLFTLAFFALKNKRDVWAGVLLGLALIKPQFVIPFSLFLALQGRGKVLLGIAVTGLCLALVSVVVFGPAILIQFPMMLLQMNQQGNAAAFHLVPEAMLNLRGLLALVLSGALSSQAVSLIVVGCSLFLFVWACRWQKTGGSFDLSFSFALLVTMLISFHLLIHDFSLIVVPVFLYLNFLQDRRSHWTATEWLRVAPLPLLFLVLLAVQLTGFRKFGVAALPLIGLLASVYLTQKQLATQAAVAATPPEPPPAAPA
jgi:hypothetical protein